MKNSAGVSDRLVMHVIRDICGKECPFERAGKGDVSATAVKAGDTVIRHDKQGARARVRSISTDFGPKTGFHDICGRRLRMSAALLQFDNGDTSYATHDIEKICPKCGKSVTRFT